MSHRRSAVTFPDSWLLRERENAKICWQLHLVARERFWARGKLQGELRVGKVGPPELGIFYRMIHGLEHGLKENEELSGKKYFCNKI